MPTSYHCERCQRVYYYKTKCGLCSQCMRRQKVDDALGMPREFAARLKVLAMAWRAATGVKPLCCLTDFCHNMAVEGYYVCSTVCRDKLIFEMKQRSMLP